MTTQGGTMQLLGSGVTLKIVILLCILPNFEFYLPLPTTAGTVVSVSPNLPLFMLILLFTVFATTLPRILVSNQSVDDCTVTLPGLLGK